MDPRAFATVADQLRPGDEACQRIRASRYYYAAVLRVRDEVLGFLRLDSANVHKVPPAVLRQALADVEAAWVVAASLEAMKTKRNLADYDMRRVFPTSDADVARELHTDVERELGELKASAAQARLRAHCVSSGWLRHLVTSKPPTDGGQRPAAPRE
jgi:hypothetical protein